MSEHKQTIRYLLNLLHNTKEYTKQDGRCMPGRPIPYIVSYGKCLNKLRQWNRIDAEYKVLQELHTLATKYPYIQSTDLDEMIRKHEDPKIKKIDHKKNRMYLMLEIISKLL